MALPSNKDKHNNVLFNDKLCKKILTKEERENLKVKFQKGASGVRNKGYWIPVPNDPALIRIFGENSIITCKKIDPNKGPFW